MFVGAEPSKLPQMNAPDEPEEEPPKEEEKETATGETPSANSR